MNINLANTVFVVEGNHDAEKLKKAGATYTVVTEGTKVPRETLNHLQALEKIHTIVILADPDKPGLYIIEKLSRALNNPVILTIPKKETIAKRKVGVENAKIEVIKTHINPYLGSRFISTSDITYNDLLSLGLMGEGSYRKKEVLYRSLPLIRMPLKGILTQLQLLNITLTKLKEILHE